MAEETVRQRDWFAPVMTLATVAVAVWSLYYSGVQAEIARKTFEMTTNEAHAGLQKDLAELQKQLAAGSTDRSLADILGRLADLQAKLADRQKRAAVNGAGALADVQQQMADLQGALAGLKKERDQKDQEIAMLRALAPTTKPSLTSGAFSGTGSLTYALTHNEPLPRDVVLPSGTINLPDPWHLAPTPSLRVEEPSPSGIHGAWQHIWSIFCKYPAPSVYFILAGLMALSKLFGRR
jgi:hypothetical protein